jgi:hypothetical protein
LGAERLSDTHPTAGSGATSEESWMSNRFAATIVTVGSAAVLAGLGAVLPPVASAVVLPPGDLVTAPEYCLAVYGDPNPCPPPDRPEPLDQDCLRINIQPLKCPYNP